MTDFSPDEQEISTESPVEGGAFKLSLADVYFILFRHKWKITTFFILGVLAAVAAVRLKPPVYQSEAKLFIKYVLDLKGIGAGAEATVVSPGAQADGVMASETEILTSMDLAEEVAKVVGAERILGSGGNNVREAAIFIRLNLATEVPRNGSTIRVAFRHSDPAVVQEVLKELISGYRRNTVEIHRNLGSMGEALSRETDRLRSQLVQTEEELQKLTAKVGVTSVDQAQKAFNDQLAKLREDRLKAEVKLAEHRARIQELEKAAPVTVQTEEVAEQTSGKPEERKVEEYKTLVERLDMIKKEKSRLLGSLTEENRVVV